MAKKIFIGIVIIVSFLVVSMPLYNIVKGNKVGFLASYYTE